MEKLLITGTSGFIGHNLKYYLSNEYHILTPNRSELDLLDTAAVKHYLKQNQVDIVLHSAIQRTFSLPEIHAQNVLQNNIRMFCNLEQCSGYYGKMVCIGSGAEYGKKYYYPLMKESYFETAVPDDPYGLSKYVISKISQSSSNIYILRAFGVFGPYEDYNHRFISNAICKMMQGKQVVIHQNVRFDYIYIDDFCELVRRFLHITPKYQAYNACTGQVVDILTIAEQVKAMLNAPSEIVVEQSGWGKEYSGDNTRLLCEIGDMKFLTLQDALSQLIEYYRGCDIHLEGDY